MMARRGYNNLIIYLDDFLTVSPSFDECKNAVATLITLLRKLGFMINYKKVVDPCNKLIFLGVELDTINMCMRLSEEKLCQLRQELETLCTRKRVTRHMLETLLGRLSWCSPLVHGGKHFMQNIIAAVKNCKHKNHKVKLQGELMTDIL